jgi:signal transduction histidine kinase
MLRPLPELSFERRDWLLALLAVSLTVYLGWCANLFRAIDLRREEVAERVRWGTTLAEIDGGMDLEGAAPAELIERLEAVARAVDERGRRAGDSGAAEELRAASRAVQAGDGARAGRLVRAAALNLRSGTGHVSAELGDLVDRTRSEALGGLVFGVASLAALVAALRTLRHNARWARRWNLVARATSDGSWSWDLRTGAVHFSPGWADLTGAPGRALSEWFDRVHPEDVTRLRADLDAHIAGESAAFASEYRLADRHGGWRYMLARGLAEREAGRATHMAVSQTDITERRTQAAQEARSRLLAHVSNATGMGFVAVDDVGGLVEASAAAHRVAAPWGAPERFWAAVAAEIRPQTAPCALCGHPEPVGSETVGLHDPSGARRFIQVTWTGHAHGLRADRRLAVAIMDDVTQRRMARAAEEEVHRRLVDSEAELRSALDTLPLAVFVVRDGEVCFSNRKAADTFGEVAARLQAIRAAAPAQRGEPRTVLVDAEGGPCSFDVFAPEPVLFDGRPSELVLARDASLRVRVESQLRSAERLVALGGLAAGLAHEINNPLTYVIGNLELAAEGVGEVSERIARALGGAVRVRQVVAQLRDLARPAPASLDTADPAEALDAAVALAAGVGLAGAEVHREFAPGLRAAADPVWVGQIGLNLVTNALQAMVASPPESRRLTLVTRRAGAEVHVVVRDTGPGVPAALRERIFEPFVSTRSSGEGSGLGLYICRELAGRMGGRLELTETGASGSTFTLVLPLPAEKPESEAPPTPPPPAHPRGRVLVVDDDVDVADLMRTYLRHHQAHVENDAEGARQALDERWHAIVLDVAIAGQSGIELWRQLQARDAEAARRVIFVTGGSLTPEVARFMLDSKNACLVKPFDFREFVRLVDRQVAEVADEA